MLRRLPPLLLLATAAGAATAIFSACSSDEAAPPPEPDAGNPVRAPFDSGAASDAAADAPGDAAGPTFHARATIAPTSAPDAGATSGSVTLDETNGSVHVTITISGATTGMHGVHIHDGTSCGDTSVDGSVIAAGAAGQPWNPNDAGVVDFGNITIAPDGTGTLNVDSKTFDVRPDAGAISAIGHAVVVRQGTNNTGAAAGCGIIQAQ